MTLADELRNCLGELLGSGIPEVSSDSEPFLFFRQWLAERNLGLVPIADPSSFDWAGKWIAQKPTLCLLAAMALKFTAEPNGQLTDETLAARIAQGDVSALEALYERYAAVVMGITLKVTGDRALAENLLQETFWQVWKSASTYQPQSGSFTGWIFRMARQIALDANRNDVHEKVSKN